MLRAYLVTSIGLLVLVLGVLAVFLGKSPGAGPRASSDTSITKITHASSSNLMPSTLKLTSSAFADGEVMPSGFTCDATPSTGAAHPPLSIAGVPQGAVSLALIMDDPDVPGGGVFDHWVLFNIPAPPVGGSLEIPVGAAAGVAGHNSAGTPDYYPPCPPAAYEPSEHRYRFKLYALDAMLDVPEGASKADVEASMQEHVLDETQLTGRYKRK